MENLQGRNLKTINNRFIENKYIDQDSTANITDKIVPLLEQQLQIFIKENLKKCPIDSTYTLNSLNEKEKEHSIYIGTGSNLYIFWRYYLLCKNKYQNKIEQSLKFFEISLLTNINSIKQMESIDKSPTSFYMGPPGIYSMGCIYYYIIRDENNFEQCLQNVLKYYDSAINEKNENELLYGNSGYLYCLLLLKTECQEYVKNNLDEMILKLINSIYLEGLKFKNEFNSGCLIWPFPKRKVKKLENVYLGAAHGTIGVLYLLLQAIIKIDLSTYYPNLINDIEISLNYLLTCRFISGNFPSSFGSNSDKLFHFCHGGTGAIPLYISAYQYFKNEEYLNCAIDLGEKLWYRGLLLKGNSICHGISGGSYSLYSLYKLTNDTLWKNRSYLFAYATFDLDIQSLCLKYDDPQRNKIGISNFPYSLMEGNGGSIALLSDLLNENVIFPGYEI